jgi:hypothetical protein
MKTVGRLAVVSGVRGSWGRTKALEPRDAMIASTLGGSRLGASWVRLAVGLSRGACALAWG